jgi:D-3-phosphoglycerate dehydrogenase
MSAARDIPIRSERKVSTSLSVSPSITFSTPPQFFSKSVVSQPQQQQQQQQRELKPFNKEEFKILLLENVNQSGKDILSGQGYQVESFKTSLPEDELIEKIRYDNGYVNSRNQADYCP